MNWAKDDDLEGALDDDELWLAEDGEVSRLDHIPEQDERYGHDWILVRARCESHARDIAEAYDARPDGGLRYFVAVSAARGTVWLEDLRS